jgi:hypothetical protein
VIKDWLLRKPGYIAFLFLTLVCFQI